MIDFNTGIDILSISSIIRMKLISIMNTLAAGTEGYNLRENRQMDNRPPPQSSPSSISRANIESTPEKSQLVFFLSFCSKSRKLRRSSINRVVLENSKRRRIASIATINGAAQKGRKTQEKENGGTRKELRKEREIV